MGEVDDYNRYDLYLSSIGESIIRKTHPDHWMTLITAMTGYSKSLASEFMIQCLLECGYLVICLTDVKKEKETAHNMFPAQEAYHVKELRKMGREPKGTPVKMWHPFTFNIPKGNLPNYNFFTIPVSSLSREEASFLAETSADTLSVKLLLDSVVDLKKTDGLFELMQMVDDKVKTQMKRVGIRMIDKPQGKFHITASFGGTKSNVSDLGGYFSPFIEDYFLTTEESPINLDVDEIFKDQEHYHCLVTNFIKDKKISSFAILSFLKKIMDNIQRCKYPIVLLLEEVVFLCPDKPQGYQQYLSEYILNVLLTARATGKGFSCIATAQFLNQVDKDLREAFNDIYFGRLGSDADLGKLNKELRIPRDVTEELISLPMGRFLRKSDFHTNAQRIRFGYPSGCHAEPHTNFEEIYHKFNKIDSKTYPLINYKELVSSMKLLVEKEDTEAKLKAYKKTRVNEEEVKRIERLKEESSIASKKLKEGKDKLKEKIELSKTDIKKKIYEIVLAQEREGNFNPALNEFIKTKEVSWRKIADKFGIKHHKTAKEYFLAYKEEMKNKDYAEEVKEEMK